MPATHGGGARSDTARERRRTPWLEAERGLTLAVLAASVAALLLAARSGLAPEQRPLTFALVLWMWIIFYYGALALPFLGLGALFATRRSGFLRFASQLGWGLATLVFLLRVGLNRPALRNLFTLDGPAHFRWLAPSAFVVAVVALGFVTLVPRIRRSLARATAVAAFVLTAAAFLPAPRPSGLSLEQRLAEAPAPPNPAPPARRFLLMGIDGADWRYIEPLMARGALPNLAALRARGAYGPLRSDRPTLSPIVWTSIATGVKPGRHGVRGFMADRLAGVAGTLPRFQPTLDDPPRLRPPRHLGLEWLEQRLREKRVIAEIPVGSDTRRVPAYWNIAAARGLPVTVVNWWATWPAEPQFKPQVEKGETGPGGVLVSERFYYDRLAQFDRLRRADGPPSTNDLTWPPELFDELRPLVLLPAELPMEEACAYFDVATDEFARMRARDAALNPALLREFNYYVASFETDRRIALHLLETRKGVDALVLFRLIDKMGHAALEYSELVDEHLGSRPEAVARYGRVFSEAYRAVDRAVGELVAAFGEGNVIVVSDHGFQLEITKERPPRRHYFHDEAPDGVFLAAGPAFRGGRVEGLSVYDVLPLLLYLRGFPTAEDQAGRVPRQAFDPVFLAAHLEARIASYGELEARRLTGGSAAVDAEETERLRALGYIRVAGAEPLKNAGTTARPSGAWRPLPRSTCGTGSPTRRSLRE